MPLLTGLNYAASYEATGPITVSRSALAFGEGLGPHAQRQGLLVVGLRRGLLLGAGTLVTESLKLYNPTSNTVLCEATLFYDNGLGTETFRMSLPSRQTVDVNVHDLVTGSARLVDVFYGITVKFATHRREHDALGAFFPVRSDLGHSLGHRRRVLIRCPYVTLQRPDRAVGAFSLE